MELLFTYFDLSKTVKNTKFPRFLMPTRCYRPPFNIWGIKHLGGVNRLKKKPLYLMYITQCIKCYTEDLFTLSQFNLHCTVRGYKIFSEWGHLTYRGHLTSREQHTSQPKLLQKLHEMVRICTPWDAPYILNP